MTGTTDPELAPRPAEPSAGVPNDGPILLTLPASPRHLRLARLAAASLGADLGLDVEGVEDLRVAVDELSAALIADADPGSNLELSFRVADGRLEVAGVLDGSSSAPFELHPVARALLEIVAGDYGVEQTDARRSFHLTILGPGADAHR